MEEKDTIEVSGNSYFKAWQMMLGIICIIFGVAFAIYGEFLFLQFNLTERILLILATSAIFVITCFTKELYEFDPNTKKERRGMKLFNYKRGEWTPFEADCTHFAFQEYDESINYDYGGLTNKNVSEKFYELRKIKNNAFLPIVKASDMKSVIAMLKLGKTLSEIYGLPFHDYVKGLAKKKNQEKS